MSGEVIYEGKAKQLVTTDDEQVLIQSFKNSATAFNGVKYAEFEGKGALNNTISCFLYEKLHEAGVATHYLGKLDDTQMTVKRLKIVPLEVVVRNVAAGSLSKRTGLEEGAALPHAIVETYYKKDELGDPILADAHVLMLDLIDADGLALLKQRALEVNAVLQPLMASVGITLVDFKLEFGHSADGELLLGDEISPDTCRLWDASSAQKLDKDVFRRDLAGLVETYVVVAQRLGLQIPEAARYAVK